MGALATEAEIAEESRILSDIHEIFDVTVAEILRRKDDRVIPLLLERVNDRTPVTVDGEDPLMTCRYRAPVRVRDKVRFVLELLLDPGDSRRMFGEDPTAEVDPAAALAYWEANRAAIQKGLKGLEPYRRP